MCRTVRSVRTGISGTLCHTYHSIPYFKIAIRWQAYLKLTLYFRSPAGEKEMEKNPNGTLKINIHSDTEMASPNVPVWAPEPSKVNKNCLSNSKKICVVRHIPKP